MTNILEDVNDQKLGLLENSGYQVVQDHDRPGLWIRSFLPDEDMTDGLEVSFGTRDEVIEYAWDHACCHVTNFHEIDLDNFNRREFSSQCELFVEAFGLDQAVESQSLDFSSVLRNITDTLAQADGAYLASVYNELCSDKIEYVKGDTFRRLPDEGEASTFQSRPPV